MEIEKASKIAFAFTVKSLGTIHLTELEYEKDIFDRWRKRGVEIEYCIPENDSTGKLHYHGIIYLEKGFYRRRLLCRGYHMKLVEIYDRAGWLRYIEKDLQYKHFEEQAEEMTTPKSERMAIPTKRLF